MSRLILIDGLPGSGKSSLAAELSPNAFFETSPNHPLHPVPTDDYGAAWARIHELVTPESFAEQSLGRWEAFLGRLDELTVVESFPFQCSIRVLLQIDAPRSLIDRYWADWQALVKPIPNQTIFLKTGDPVGLLNRIADRRGEEWKRYISEACDQMPFGKSRGLSGWAAVEAFMRAYAGLIEELISRADVPIAVFDAEPSDYAARSNEVRARLPVPSR